MSKLSLTDEQCEKIGFSGGGNSIWFIDLPAPIGESKWIGYDSSDEHEPWRLSWESNEDSCSFSIDVENVKYLYVLLKILGVKYNTLD